jgi:hypothetical protein
VGQHHADRVGLSGDKTTRCQIGLIVQLFDFAENAPPRAWTDVSVIAENFGNGNYGHAELVSDVLHSYLHAATLAMPAECRMLRWKGFSVSRKNRLACWCNEII